MANLKILLDSLPGLVLALAQLLLAVAAVVTAWKSRNKAKETVNEKRKD